MSAQLFKGRRILLIDDDSTVLAVVSQRLEMLGCAVDQSEDGRAGREMIRANRPDLIVLDIVLRGEDGIEICKELKADEATQSIPVVFLSAKEEPKERVRGLRAGAIDYVVKPFDLDELILRLDIALRIKSDLRESVAEASQPAPAPAPSGPTTEAPKRPAEALAADEFLQTVERRFNALDPESGLLTLAFIRGDLEGFLLSEENVGVRRLFLEAVHEILAQVLPKGTLVGEMDPIQLGLLIPKKNKYNAELVLDELRNLLAVRAFGESAKDLKLTLSCGVAEFPNSRIENSRQFVETAEFALRRAQHRGGDQTVLM
ncbi:MAG: response regulator [Candidatus Omnitrophica bacterium]|nr:response regulator [Candidatus Omnitrophota bacterium]